MNFIRNYILGAERWMRTQREQDIEENFPPRGNTGIDLWAYGRNTNGFASVPAPVLEVHRVQCILSIHRLKVEVLAVSGQSVILSREHSVYADLLLARRLLIEQGWEISSEQSAEKISTGRLGVLPPVQQDLLLPVTSDVCFYPTAESILSLPPVTKPSLTLESSRDHSDAKELHAKIDRVSQRVDTLVELVERLASKDAPVIDPEMIGSQKQIEYLARRLSAMQRYLFLVSVTVLLFFVLLLWLARS